MVEVKKQHRPLRGMLKLDFIKLAETRWPGKNIRRNTFRINLTIIIAAQVEVLVFRLVVSAARAMTILIVGSLMSLYIKCILLRNWRLA